MKDHRKTMPDGTGPARSRKALLLAAALGLAAVPALAFVPMAGASPAPCKVTDLTHPFATPQTSLSSAVGLAKSNDTLKVTGTCVGDTEINKSLTINGSATLSGRLRRFRPWGMSRQPLRRLSACALGDPVARWHGLPQAGSRTALAPPPEHRVPRSRRGTRVAKE
jgi:hypothetical protein